MAPTSQFFCILLSIILPTISASPLPPSDIPALHPRDATTLTRALHEIHTSAAAVTSAYHQYTQGYLSFVPIYRANTALIDDITHANSELQNTNNAEGWPLSVDEATNVLAYITDEILPEMKRGQTESYKKMSHLVLEDRDEEMKEWVKALRSGFWDLGKAIENVTPSVAWTEFTALFKQIDFVFEMYNRQLDQ